MKDYILEDNKEIIIEIINEIRMKVSKVKNINVDYKINKNGFCNAKIELRFGRKKFIASKEGINLKQSLLNSMHAILKQLQKFQNRNKKIYYRNLLTA